MDRTEKYVAMMRTAWEIQKLIHEKDFFDYRSRGYCTKHECFLTEGPDGDIQCPEFVKKLRFDLPARELDRIYETALCEGKYWIGLLRQDESQKIIFTDPADTVNIRVNRFANQFCLQPYFGRKEGTLPTYWFDTEEQLWAAMVMREKFGKVWDEDMKKWIRIEEVK